MNTKRCCFFISEIAGLLGENPYKDADEEIANLVKRHTTGERTYSNFVVPEEHAELIEKLIASEKSSHIGNTLEQLNGSEEEIDGMKRKVFTERGIRDEIHALDTYEKEHNIVIERPTNFMKKHYLKNNKEFFIGGKIDGLIRNKQGFIVVEVKNRQSKLFNVIPQYERIQIECYMRILNSNKCIFIQRFEGENVVDEYTRDDELWNMIVLRLSDIIREFIHA